MIRKVLSGAGVLAMVLGGMVFAQGGVAGALTPVTLSGHDHLRCHRNRQVQPGTGQRRDDCRHGFSQAKLTDCSGSGASGDGVTLLSGHLTATATTTINNDCGEVFNGSDLPQLNGTAKWKGMGGHIEGVLHLDHRRVGGL